MENVEVVEVEVLAVAGADLAISRWLAIGLGLVLPFPPSNRPGSKPAPRPLAVPPIDSRGDKP